MMEKYLLIVEGEKTEKNILNNIFINMGFNVIDCKKKLSNDMNLEIDESVFEKDNKNIILVQGPRTRIHDILINANIEEYGDINYINVETLFGYTLNEFKGCFWIYDVDHNDDKDIELMFNNFNDEMGNGLLLLSSPCIEVLAEYDFKRELKCEHLKEYKALLNCYYNKKKYKSALDYIIKNLKAVLLCFLTKNYEEFNDSNIMNHPEEIISKIKEFNTRDNSKNHYVLYRYFSTVIYCAIAYVLGLTREIDNYEIVKDYFENKFEYSSK